MGVPLLAGRAFSREESDRGDAVAIVNETLASRLWPGGDAVGRALVVGPERRADAVVGVARDAKYRAITERRWRAPVRPAPAGLLPDAAGSHRRRAAPGAGRACSRSSTPSAREWWASFRARWTIISPPNCCRPVWPRLPPPRSSAVGLALSGVGLYGLVAWLVERRRRGDWRQAGARRVARVGGATGRDPGRACRRCPGSSCGAALAAALGWALRARAVRRGPARPVGLRHRRGCAGRLVVGVAAWRPCRRACGRSRSLRDPGVGASAPPVSVPPALPSGTRCAAVLNTVCAGSSAPVAQLDRALASGARGRRFESCRARHVLPDVSRLAVFRHAAGPRAVSWRDRDAGCAGLHIRRGGPVAELASGQTGSSPGLVKGRPRRSVTCA